MYVVLMYNIKYKECIV